MMLMEKKFGGTFNENKLQKQIKENLEVQK